DPLIWSYSTYFGGNDEEWGNAVAVDRANNIIVVGETSSTDMPLLNAYQTFEGGSDIFIAKFSPDGQSLLYSTYLGGNSQDTVIDIDLDGADNILLTGFTQSTDFPTVNPYQSSRSGAQDAFISKLSSDGQTLLFSTYLGGNEDDRGWRVAFDPSGNIIMAGYSFSTNFPTANASQPAYGGGQCDFIIVKFSPDGQALQFSTYWGTSGNEFCHGLALDVMGNIIVAGTGGSPSNSAVAVIKFSSDGQIIFQKFLDGINDDYGNAVVLDAIGNFIVTGSTFSSNFPIVSAAQQTYGGGEDIFVTKFDENGTILFSTYLGGNQLDHGYNLILDETGNILVTGVTQSSNFPLVNPLQQSFGGGQFDAYMIRLNINGELLDSTYIGGTGHDGGMDLVFNTNKTAIFLVGSSTSNNFPLVNAYQTCSGGDRDAFICKFVFNTTSSEPTITPSTCIQPTTESSTTITSSETITSIVTTTSGFESLFSISGILLIAVLVVITSRRNRTFN
ncbi:MAG: SBBP repeat-containing protein, partial [Candidatus Hodarchaeota archaeon]